MDKRTAICHYLRQYHTGMGNAVYSRELEQRFAIDGRDLRRKISRLRLDGYTKVFNSRNGLLRSQAIPVMQIDVTIHLDSLQEGAMCDENRDHLCR